MKEKLIIVQDRPHETNQQCFRLHDKEQDMTVAPRTVLANRICRILLPLWLVVHISMAVGFAAQPSLSDAEEQNRRARQEAEERQQREHQKDVFLQNGERRVEDAALPDETPSFPISTVKLEGDSLDRFPWASQMLQRYQGRKIGIVGINIIVKRLTGAFIDRGYITTRISVPEQDLASGTLTLILVPGRIGEIRFADSGAGENWQTAFPARPGDILNLRHLEQGLEQLKRVPSQDATMEIVPGRNPGESDVVISLKKIKPWRLSLTADDSGIRATGKLQLSATAAVDNLLGLNDLFNVSLSGDGDRKGNLLGTRGDSLYYSVPHGDTTFTLSSYSYRSHQLLAGVNYSSDIYNIQFGVSQLLQRDQTSKTSLDFAVSKGSNRSFFGGAEIDIQRQFTTDAQLGLSHRQYFGQATLDASLAYKKGVPWFGAQADPAVENPAMPTTRYGIWLVDTGLTQPLNIGGVQGRYSAVFHGQFTHDTLFGSQFVSIGNRYTVRGFDGEQTLSAERGWYLRNELAVPLGASGLETYLGLDYGEVYGPTPQTVPGRILAGTAVGLRGAAKGLTYDLFVGWPLRRPDGFQTAPVTFGFQTVYQF